jgi:hypothetical protein
MQNIKMALHLSVIKANDEEDNDAAGSAIRSVNADGIVLPKPFQYLKKLQCYK